MDITDEKLFKIYLEERYLALYESDDDKEVQKYHDVRQAVLTEFEDPQHKGQEEDDAWAWEENEKWMQELNKIKTDDKPKPVVKPKPQPAVEPQQSPNLTLEDSGFVTGEDHIPED